MNSLFRKIPCMEIVFLYSVLLSVVHPKQRMILSEKIAIFKKSLIDIYNYIFLTYLA